MRSFFPAFAALTFALLGTNAFAFEQEGVVGYTPGHGSHRVPKPEAPAYNPDRLPKFELVLQTIGVPAEPKPDFSEFPDQSELVEADVRARLPYIDPHHGLIRYLDLNADTMGAFLDFFSAALPKGSLEYLFHFSKASVPSDSAPLINHLTEIAEQVKKADLAKPLTGLKIVIDPGHMGTDTWDEATGKYVSIGKEKVSEGDINLWTAYLAANALEDLGATVILTRDKQGTVSDKTLQNYDAAPYIAQYFYDSLDAWMPKYLTWSDSQIKSNIKDEAEIKKGLSAATVGTLERGQLFIEGEDLQARSRIVNEQKPDIMIDIHYDAEDLHKLQSDNDTIDSFVPGGFLATETGSRKMRRNAFKHLLDQRRWNESVNLATELVQAMAKSEGIALQKNEGFVTAPKIKDGVYARNLYITSRNLSALMVYLECLHYDYTTEFKQMLNLTETGSYHGVTFKYPKRLDAVAFGIKTGMLNYFKR